MLTNDPGLLGLWETQTVEGHQLCSEELGACSISKIKECQQKCELRHPNDPKAQGACDSLIRPMLCMCSYNCGLSSPLEKKLCKGGVGTCSSTCGDACCNAKCAAKFSQGKGFCSQIGSTRLCQCEYLCD